MREGAVRWVGQSYSVPRFEVGSGVEGHATRSLSVVATE